MKFVTSTAQLLSFFGAANECEQSLVQPAREPSVSTLLLDFVRNLVRTLIAKLLRVRLTARHATVEKDAMPAADVRFGRNGDLFLRVNFKISWRARESRNDKGIFGVRLRSEILPKKALHWVQVRRIFLAFHLG